MKRMQKIIMVLLAILFILLTPVALLFTDVQLVAFNRSYFEKQYQKYNIPQAMNISMEELMKSTDNLLLYMDDKRENLDFTADFNGQSREFFSDRDKAHMIDVQALFIKGKLLRNLSAAYILAFLIYLVRSTKNWKGRLAGYSIYTVIAGITPILLLILLMSIDFNKYFTIFHQIFFNNDLWLLDPAADTLVNMFPESFFADTAFRIGYLYIAELMMLITASLLYKFIKKKAVHS